MIICHYGCKISDRYPCVDISGQVPVVILSRYVPILFCAETFTVIPGNKDRL